MSFNRRYFSSSGPGGERAPSDEMLAVDAASEMRSFTLLYERYADRLYRYFLVCTGDPQTADLFLRNLLERLPRELQRFRPADQSFSGWLFRLASRRLNAEQSLFHRVFRRMSRSGERRSGGFAWESGAEASEYERVNAALQRISFSEREIIGINIAAGLSTMATSEALRLPASLVASHVSQAVRSAARELDSTTDPTRLSEQLRSAFSQTVVSPEQRNRHLGLIHLLFYEVEDVDDEPVQRSSLVRDISALVAVAVLGLVGLWVYGLVAPGDPSADSSPSVEVNIGSQPDSTATPAPSPEATEESDTATGGGSGICPAMDSKSVFDTFVLRYNQGDFAAVREMLPDASYEHPLYERNDMETDPDALEYFRHHGTELSDPEEIVSYLERRHRSGERWGVIEAYPAEHYRAWHGAAPLEMYVDWKREFPGLGMVVVGAMTRTADDFHTHSSLGRVTVDCDEGLVIEWSIKPNESLYPEPVTADEFLDVMSPLDTGEVRDIRAAVTTDWREDGGALSSWDIRWRQAVWHDGTELERIDVRMLDGGRVISFVDDGSRWRLDHRGWVTYGRSGDVSLPEEVSLPLPWIQAVPDLLRENDIPNEGVATISRDLSFSAGSTTERWFEIDIDGGRVVAGRLREATSNGMRMRPEIQFLRVVRAERFNPSDFAVQLQPRFPENDVFAPRFKVPDQWWPQLEVIEMIVGDEGDREEYRLRWNEVEFDLIVMPSRGGLDLNSVPDGVDESWATAIANYRYGRLAWAHRHFAGYPTDAIWDNGIYRFELAVDRDAMSPEHNWSLGRLVDLVNALSEPPAGDVADRERYQDRNSMVHTAAGLI